MRRLALAREASGMKVMKAMKKAGKAMKKGRKSMKAMKKGMKGMKALVKADGDQYHFTLGSELLGDLI